MRHLGSFNKAVQAPEQPKALARDLALGEGGKLVNAWPHTTTTFVRRDVCGPLLAFRRPVHTTGWWRRCLADCAKLQRMKGDAEPNGDLKILLIEDHPLIIDGCKRIFESREYILLSTATSAAAGLEANKRERPDIVILDISLPDKNGLEIVKPLMSESPKAMIIVLSMYSESTFVDRALELGVSAYISKSDDPTVILTAVDKVLRGEIYLGQALAQTFVLETLSEKLNPVHALTEREKKILKQLGKGRGLAEVAADVGLSYKTVANAVTLIKHKLKTPTNAALIKFAVEHLGR